MFYQNLFDYSKKKTNEVVVVATGCLCVSSVFFCFRLDLFYRKQQILLGLIFTDLRQTKVLVDVALQWQSSGNFLSFRKILFYTTLCNCVVPIWINVFFDLTFFFFFCCLIIFQLHVTFFQNKKFKYDDFKKKPNEVY